MKRHSRGDEAGQTILIAALAMIPLLIMVGLVIDGGFAYASQRRNQNAMDAAANAGAVLLMENLPFSLTGQTPPRTDADVEAAVVAVAGTNGVEGDDVEAWYTDIEGNRITDPLTGNEIQVGSLDAVQPPADALGVEAIGSMTFNTFFAQVAGFNTLSTGARATAVTGTANGICAASEDCGFIPLTFPTSLTSCDGTNHQEWGSGGAYTTTTNLVAAFEVIIPLCSTEPGSVGWLDILPQQTACPGNGAAYLACYINNPNNPQLDLPIWIDAQTGNTNSVQVQDALNLLTGPTVGVYEPGLDKIVTIPLYDCVDNNVPQVSPGPPCPNPPITGVGTNTSYRIVALAAMALDKAYIQGNNPECNQAPGSPFVGGNGSTGCIKGWLTQISGPGEVGAPPPPGGIVGSQFRVQLIK
ncbi:MAG TPA: pilus assembly protein TadG-related protein [Actinomycetes bacterium]|nr:pilus assembly protein TadG-related protein [Actinomycetes bacterium]